MFGTSCGMSAPEGRHHRGDHHARRSSHEEGNPNHPNPVSRARRSGRNRAGGQPRPPRGKRHRDVADVSRACGQAAQPADTSAAENFARARAGVSRGPDCALAGSGIAELGPCVGRDVASPGIRASNDLPATFENGVTERAEGLITTAETMFYVIGAQVAELAARHRLPAIYHHQQNVTDRGGLMAYSPNSSELFRRAATYAARILKGAKPADLPVQQPTTFEFVINLNTAKVLGLTIAPGVLASFRTAQTRCGSRVAKIAVMHNAACFSNDVVGCDPRREGST